MKKIISVVMAICFVLALSSCGGSKKTIDVNAFAEKVVDAVAFGEDVHLMKLSEKVAGKQYDLKIEGLEKYSIYVDETSATASELAVFEGKNTTAVNSIKASCEKRLKDLMEAYENYRPDEVGRINNAIIRTNGNYVLLAVSDDNAAIDKMFSDALK